MTDLSMTLVATGSGNMSDLHNMNLHGNESSNTYHQYETFYLRARFITGLVFYPIICVFGITSNIMSIIVMSQRQMLQNFN
ncbi:hypothetical protein DPMN_180941 [Dreissena polymorpha]|uniref:Uncharacterized protein n=1 Tax=Dreissena polymorpha TaxID=45954 RepID=A0A9D4DDA1_DREPO|nr:hypothetical protein DPMN_180941 [Dreissena polymorpha]